MRRLGNDVEHLEDIAELGLGAKDSSLGRYALKHDRLILTKDDDFFTDLDIEDTAGVLFQRDQMLSTREVGNTVHEMSQYLDQSDVILEYISENWP